MIRKLVQSDIKDVEETFFNSFSAEEAPITFSVIKRLITDNTSDVNYCIGYELDGKIVSAVGFSPVFFKSDNEIFAYILAPLATHQSHQNKGLATTLIESAKAYFSENGVDALLVYGDPEYYGRYGFNADLGKQFIPPYPLEYDFGWQALMLNDTDLNDRKLTFTCVDALSDAALW
ncbi:N-acetyltransferase [Alphaproteobacteria bacterium]|nr:N-acetyltransferase [Alphaproteobacteria bacterium]